MQDVEKKNIFCTLFFVMYFPNRIFICIWHPVTVVIFYSDSFLMFPFLAISLHIAVSLSFLTPYVIFLPYPLVSKSLIPVSISPIFHVPQLLFLRCLFKAIVVSSSSNHFWIHSPMEPSTHHPSTRPVLGESGIFSTLPCLSGSEMKERFYALFLLSIDI